MKNIKFRLAVSVLLALLGVALTVYEAAMLVKGEGSVWELAGLLFLTCLGPLSSIAEYARALRKKDTHQPTTRNS